MKMISSPSGKRRISLDNLSPHSLRDRHHVFVKIPGDVQLAEVGPRFEMKRASPALLVLFTQ